LGKGFWKIKKSRQCIKKKMPETLIVVNSKDGSNRSADGSSYDVVFDAPIKAAFGTPHLKVLSSTIWYTFPNVKTGSNELIIRHGAGLTLYSSLVIPQGLYSIGELNSAIQHQIGSQGLAGFLSDTIAIAPNYATGRATVTLTIPTSMPTQHIEIDWGNSSLAPLLGFTTAVSLDAASGNYTATFFGDDIASLSPVASLQIHCSVARGSVVSGKTDSAVLASIQIDARPGFQILYNPVQAPRVLAPEFGFSSGVRSMRMRLTDQDGNALNTQNESWTATLLLEW
jgi:hypothetical protein